MHAKLTTNQPPTKQPTNQPPRAPEHPTNWLWLVGFLSALYLLSADRRPPLSEAPACSPGGRRLCASDETLGRSGAGRPDGHTPARLRRSHYVPTATKNGSARRNGCLLGKSAAGRVEFDTGPNLQRRITVAAKLP